MGKARKSPDDGLRDFASNIKSLEALIEKLEGNETNLEDSLVDFERGVQLIRGLQKTLSEAEQRVLKLVEKNGTLMEEPFLLDEDQE